MRVAEIPPARASRWRRFLVGRHTAPWTVIVGMTCFGGFLFGLRLSSPPPDEEPVNLSAAGLVVDSHALNLGELLAQREFHWTIPVKNTSSQPVALTEIASSCGCTSVEPDSVVIPAGQSRDLHLTLDLTFRSALDSQTPTWPFDIMLQPVAEAAGERYRLKWRLQGRVRSYVEVVPPQIYLGERSVRAAPFPPQTVLLSFDGPVAEVTVESGSGDLQASVEPAAPGDTRQYRLRISESGPEHSETTPAGFPVGPINTNISVYPVGEGGKRLPPVHVPVSGQIQTDVAAQPESIMFGIRAAGETARAELSLRSRTGRAFTVEAVAAESPDLVIRPIEEAPAGHAYQLVQKIDGPGYRGTDIVFHVRHADDFREDVRMRVSYVATSGKEALPAVAPREPASPEK